MSELARERIRTLVESNDGFYIAEMDMKLRGPGEFFGTRQSGLPSLQIGNIVRDADMLEIARNEAAAFVAHPPSEGRAAPRRHLHPRSLAAPLRIGAGRLTMRVIGGEFRSRTLKSLPGLDVRPTPDRLRESLFNMLAPRIEGAIFVDLYAGTGAVGIEALSRGAAKAIFVEQKFAAVRAIRENLRSLEIEARAEVRQGRATVMIPQHRSRHRVSRPALRPRKRIHHRARIAGRESTRARHRPASVAPEIGGDLRRAPPHAPPEARR